MRWRPPDASASSRKLRLEPSAPGRSSPPPSTGCAEATRSSSGASTAWRDRATRRLIVGEAKSRHCRGDVTPYERYQVTLYLGMAKRLYRMPATAIILFGNGRRVPMEFDSALYDRLLALLPGCRKGAR